MHLKRFAGTSILIGVCGGRTSPFGNDAVRRGVPPALAADNCRGRLTATSVPHAALLHDMNANV